MNTGLILHYILPDPKQVRVLQVILHVNSIFSQIGYTINDDMVHLVKEYIRTTHASDSQVHQTIVDGTSSSQPSLLKRKGVSHKDTANGPRLSYNLSHSIGGSTRNWAEVKADVVFLLLRDKFPFAHRYSSVSVVRLSRRC
jgi:hypothetical protein